MENNHSILLVDDEADLIEILKDFFEDLNFFSRVMTVSSAEKALEIIKNETISISIVFSDDRLGSGMSGRDLLNEIVKSGRSDIQFYLATGNLDIIESDLIKAGATGLIYKPYDIEEVVNRVMNDCKKRNQ